MPFEIAPRQEPATFRLGLQPGEVFEHPSWQGAIDAAHAAVAGGGRALVVGAAGTGKSLLLQTLRRRLEGEGTAVHLVAHGALLPPADEPAPILVDEADRLDPAALGELLARPNPLALAGLDGLPGAVEAALPGAAPIQAVTLAPLDPVALARFVAERLAAGDRPADVFTPGAIAALATQSDGIFRAAVVLAGSSLFFAQMRGSDRVTAADVEDAAAIRATLLAEAEVPPDCTPPDPAPPASDPEPVRRARRPFPARLVGAGFGAALVALALVLSRPAPPPTPVAAPPTAAPPVAAPPAPPSAPVAAAPESPAPSPPPPSAAPAPPGPGRLLAPAAFRGSLAPGSADPAPEILLRLQNQADDAAGAIRGTVRDVATGGVGRIRGTLAADGTVELAGKALLARREYAITLRGRIEDRQITAEVTLVRGRDGPRTVATVALSRE